MEKFIFLPSETEIKSFQNAWFLKDHIGLILHTDRRFPVARESNVKTSRPNTYMTSARVVKAYKRSATSLHIKTVNPCVSNLNFIAFHIGDKGVIIDKENGQLICIVEGSFEMIHIDNKNDIIVIKNKLDLTCQVIQKVKTGQYKIEETNKYSSLKEEKVSQNIDLINVQSIKVNLFSWEACFYHKFVEKNLDEIKQWEVDM
jgi:hypothetical protein